MTRQVLVAVVLYWTNSTTVPMHTLVPSPANRHHRWPPWLRPGLVMKPWAGKIAGVTPRHPVAACAAVPACGVGVCWIPFCAAPFWAARVATWGCTAGADGLAVA